MRAPLLDVSTKLPIASGLLRAVAGKRTVVSYRRSPMNTWLTASPPAVSERLNLPRGLPWHIVSAVEHDMHFVDISDLGEVNYLPAFEWLEADLKELGPGAFVVIDSLIDAAILDENHPRAVDAFCKRFLRDTLCGKFGATVYFLAHPSKTAMMTGAKYAGSVAGNNAVRVRHSLERSNKNDKTDPARTFTLEKANDLPPCSIDLVWQSPGIFTQANMVDKRTRFRDAVVYGAVYAASIDRHIKDRGVAIDEHVLNMIGRHAGQPAVKEADVKKALKDIVKTPGSPISYIKSSNHGDRPFGYFPREAGRIMIGGAPFNKAEYAPILARLDPDNLRAAPATATWN